MRWAHLYCATSFAYMRKFKENTLLLSMVCRLLIASMVLSAIAACSSTVNADNSRASPAQSGAQQRAAVTDLYIVDCLLPGQVRQLGKRTYLTPRRPTRATAADCRLRGGEYVAYDRADYKTALKVWMAAAEAGDADAQNNVGEIFERGLGGSPNYEAALIWYEKAAAQDHAAAQFNLGTLYEQGNGVAQDKLVALNYYRQSWGLQEDNLIYQSAATREADGLRQELESQISDRDTQIKLLQQQLDRMQQRHQEQSSNTSEAAAEMKQLQALVNRLKQEQSEKSVKLATLPARTRSVSPDAMPDESFTQSAGISYSDKNFGRYYALVIGNQDYEELEDLASPVSDAKRVKSILENKYGFTVQMILDANDATVMDAINQLNKVVGEQDNLLIYYAGHGSRRKAGKYEVGYWLPVNANRPPVDTYWVPTEQITSHMANFKAKRVLVVADSCYSGILSNDPGMLMVGDNRMFQSPAYIDLRFPKKSRLLMSAGGDSPVLDAGSSGHSVFAQAFIDELESNQTLLTTPSLFLKVRDRVSEAAARQNFDQVPEIKALKRAGHEVGDFFFVPKADRG